MRNTKTNKIISERIKLFDLNYKPTFKERLNIVINKIMKKKRISIIFISTNKEIFLKYMFFEKKKSVDIGDCTYIFNEEHFYTHKNTPILILYENKATPISFIDGMETVDANLLNAFMKSNIIEKLMVRNDSFLSKVNKEMVMIIGLIVLFFYLMSEGFFNGMM